jgi:hypothetical protein
MGGQTMMKTSRTDKSPLVLWHLGHRLYASGSGTAFFRPNRHALTSQAFLPERQNSDQAPPMSTSSPA